VSPPPRVAVFSTNFLPASQTFVHDQLRHHRRYVPEVFCWRRQHPERFPFAPVHRARPLYGLTAHDAAFHRRFTAHSTTAPTRTAAPFALIHAHFATGATYALPYARTHRLPLVVSFHGYDVPLLWNRRRFHPPFWPFLLRARPMLETMALGLCASDELRELLASHGVPAAKLRTHRLGIDLERWKPSPRSGAAESPNSFANPTGSTEPSEPTDTPLRVAMVGRFVPKKGHHDALDAFARHRRRHPRSTLVLVGAGPLRRSLEQRAHASGLDVTFRGELPWTGVRQVLRRAHVLLAPSRVAPDGDRDSGLMVAKEASALGTVVVGTRHGGIPSIVDHERTGLLASEGDVVTLAAHLDRLTRPAARAPLAAAAIAKMRAEYSLPERVAELEALYDEARRIGPG